MVTIETVTRIRAPIARCFDLARSVEVHLAGNVHSGEQAVAAGGVTTGLIGLGQRVTWRARHFGIRWTLSSGITALHSPDYFHDEMLRGPFARMEHDHYFRALGPEETEMRDVFCFAAPFGPLGRLAEVAVLRRYMARLLDERNRALREIAECGS
jgi:ligand-binding SRPBCC domain-containing protein